MCWLTTGGLILVLVVVPLLLVVRVLLVLERLGHIAVIEGPCG